MLSKLEPSRILLVICAGIILGVAIATKIDVSKWKDVLLAGSCFFVLAVFAVRNARLRLMLLCAIVFCAALWRVNSLPDYTANPYDQMLTFQGTVVREPEILIDTQRIVVDTLAVEGLVQIKRPLQPRYQVGERLEIYCFLRKPEAFDGFAYDKYLERYGVSGQCHYPGIKSLGVQGGAMTRLFAIKQWLQQRVEQSMPSPENSIILGALFGNKRAIPPSIMDAFRATGTSHVLVISGMHVALLTAFLANILKVLGCNKRSVALLVMVSLALYVTLTGFQASAIRASLFGSSALVAELLGRQKSSLRLLLVVGAGMLLWNPLLLWFDAGFQLSFAATSGIIVFNPFFQKRLALLPEQFGLRSTAATSVSAIVATTPITAFSFNTFSPIALIANILVVPFMPIVMTYSIVLTGVAALSTQIATWLSLPLYYLLRTLIAVVDWLSKWQFASVDLPDIHWLAVWIAIGGLVWWGYRLVSAPEAYA